ncbi:MAG TPA: gluconate 2-dehydrogenase subunit 3 family protein [Solirubrobacteraceae bacterium]|jgi:gluconate 2-dehydrogenase gamma chain|nr:gluconate 2-dehydrogenase subunit 3 family protein [Solirubrobacteraceae bacterium]
MARDGNDGVSDANVTRRSLFKLSGVAGIAMAIPAAGTVHVVSAAADSGNPPVAGLPLTTDQDAVLTAFVDRLIPTDATGAGAVEAGVASFIARSLQGGLSGGLEKLAGFYTANLAAVDAYAQTAYGGSFASLSPTTQDSVVADVESGKATGFTPDAPTFFATIREHTLEGMFSDPAYGGNQNFAGWDLIGYTGVVMPLPAKDQELGVKVTPAHQSTYAKGEYPGANKEAVA